MPSLLPGKKRKISHMRLNVKRLSENAILPTRGTDGSIGFDLYALDNEYSDIGFGQITKIKTGIALEIPKGYYGRIAPRSGLAVKHGIHVLAGVVDPDYRGEIIVLLTSCIKGAFFRVKPGDRIAQLILERADALPIYEVEEFDDEETKRGQGGFGSTGV